VIEAVEFDADLIQRYDVTGPRYTSYPTAPWFHEEFDGAAYERAAREADPSRALSLYFHLPFCATLCFYCACNKIVTGNRAHAGPYLDRLEREIAMQAELFGNRPSVDQLHWGGGTPTFLDHDRMRWLVDVIRHAYPLRDDDRGDYSIELDPRSAPPKTVELLRELGFNRASIGVQDFDPDVQNAVNRRQPMAVTRATYEACREHGFHSINFDLIYGLPKQTLERFTRTLDQVIAFAPDRIAIYNYAHLPQYFPAQRQIDEADLPGAADRLAILGRAIERLTNAGYIYIGMDHFALPHDPLAQAQQAGTLTRNFQGYTTHGDCDLIAHGTTGIGHFGNCYSQNVRDLAPYYAAVDADKLPISRGRFLSCDDRVRRDLIQRLMCEFALDVPAFEARHGVDFARDFAAECEALEPLIRDGLVEWRGSSLRVRGPGRLLVRNVAMVFDRYLQYQRESRFSRVI